MSSSYCHLSADDKKLEHLEKGTVLEERTKQIIPVALESAMQQFFSTSIILGAETLLECHHMLCREYVFELYDCHSLIWRS